MARLIDAFATLREPTSLAKEGRGHGWGRLTWDIGPDLPGQRKLQ